MRIDAIKNKVSKIRDLLEDLKSEIEIDICDLEERENLNERQEEKYDFLNGLKEVLEDADYSLSDYE
jgi:hypothetical protein